MTTIKKPASHDPFTRVCIELIEDERSIYSITANEDHCARYAERSIGIVTALVPHIGYDNAGRIAGLALDSGLGVAELVRREGLLSAEPLAAILSPSTMTTNS